MEFTGMLSAARPLKVGTYITIETTADLIDECEKLKDKPLSIEIKLHKKKRSIDANAFLWKMIGDMSAILRTDKWSIYIQMLKQYGKYTYIAVKPNVVEAVKKQWREVEEVGEIEINGQKAIQLLCYFGSSTLDSKEFSILLDGVISEAKELGIETISDKEYERMIKCYTKNGKT